MTQLLDGYNKFATIKSDGLEVIIEYRPALAHERRAVFSAASIHTPDRAREIFNDQIKSRVVNASDLARLPDFLSHVLNAVMGLNPLSTERSDAENLAKGTKLYAQYPHLPFLDCSTCRKWFMDPVTNKYHKRRGKPQPRDEGEKLLCETGEGCPKGSYQDPVTFSPKNKDALRHYLECRATGTFPDDSIVRQNAKIISHAIFNAQSKQIVQFQL